MLVAAGVKSLQIEHSELVSQYGGSTIDGYRMHAHIAAPNPSI